MMQEDMPHVHEASVETIRDLDEQYNTQPARQLPQVLVPVPRFGQQLLRIDRCLASFGSGNDMLLSIRHFVRVVKLREFEEKKAC